MADMEWMMENLKGKTEGFLAGLKFPTTKDELVARAKESKVGSEMIEKLQALPDKTYDKMKDVMEKIGIG